jgi:hypothetical protein
VRIGTTITDQNGLFQVAPPGLGSYRLIVDGAGVRESTFPPFSFDGHILTYRLLAPAVSAPPMASDSIMLLACGDIVPPGRAVIIGMATMADSVLRAPGTQIIVESRDLPIRLAQLASTVGTQTDTVETGDDGLYALCGIRFESTVALYAERDFWRSRRMLLTFRDGRMDDGTALRSMDGRLWRQDLDLHPRPQMTTRVVGLVVDTSGAPLSNVEVEAHGGVRTVRTDDGGWFLLDAPRGVVTLETRLLGYQSSIRDFSVDASSVELPVPIEMRRLPVRLADVTIEGVAPSEVLRSVGFYEREHRWAGGGRFVSIDEYRERKGNPTHAMEVLTSMRGIKIVRVAQRYEDNWVALPQYAPSIGIRCGRIPPAIYLDGMYIGTPPDIDINSINIDWIDGVEAYTTVPEELRRGRPKGCGAIFFWTKR